MPADILLMLIRNYMILLISYKIKDVVAPLSCQLLDRVAVKSSDNGGTCKTDQALIW